MTCVVSHRVLPLQGVRAVCCFHVKASLTPQTSYREGLCVHWHVLVRTLKKPHKRLSLQSPSITRPGCKLWQSAVSQSLDATFTLVSPSISCLAVNSDSLPFINLLLLSSYLYRNLPCVRSHFAFLLILVFTVSASEIFRSLLFHSFY